MGCLFFITSSGIEPRCRPITLLAAIPYIFNVVYVSGSFKPEVLMLLLAGISVVQKAVN